jgi:hypothetical protein
VAEKLETEFLSRYFGTNEQVLGFAKDLIVSGRKEAAKLLNQIVDVMGSDVDAKLLIDRVQERFPNSFDHEVQELSKELTRTGRSVLAIAIAKLRGYEVEQPILSVAGYLYAITKEGEVRREFKTTDEFTSWVQRILC